VDDLSDLKDFRLKARTTFSVAELVMPAVAARLLGGRSNRQHDLDKQCGHYVANMLSLSHSGLDRLPHSDTIKYFLEREPTEVLAGLQPVLFQKLLRDRRVYGMRCRPVLDGGRCAFLVAVDGVHFHTSSAPIGHSTHRTHSNGTTEYMLTALQATVVSCTGVKIPLMTEFIENPDGDYDKQDCELKACKRLLGKLKEKFQHLPVILLMDGLYLCGDILDICRKNNWKISVTVTGRASAFEAKAIGEMEGRGHCIEGADPKTGGGRTIKWCNGVKHKFGDGEVSLNVIMSEITNRKGEKTTLFYATTIFLHDKEGFIGKFLDEICRSRWRIEESFDEQKHHGLELETAFGTRGYAGQNYYLIVQIAYIIQTFMCHTSLFKRLRQHENPGRADMAWQCPALDWYVSIRNMRARLRTAFLGRDMDRLDMSGWRLEFDTA